MNVDLPSCIAGRKDAWDQFVCASAPVIYAAVRKSLRARGKNAGEIADRVQDVYVRLLREDCRLLRTFDPQRASLATWLTLIARTVVHEHARRKSLPTTHLDAPDATLAATTGGASRYDEPSLTLDDLPLNLLTAQQRQIMDMLFREGLSVDQAAQRLGVEPQTIRSAKHKALTRLRTHLSSVTSEEVDAGGFARPAAGDGDELPMKSLQPKEPDDLPRPTTS